MKSQRYQQLNPLALAVAAGCTELIVSLFVGLSMMGMMGGPAMMGAYTHGSAMALGAMWWIGAFLTALGGAAFAWIYNAINTSRSSVGKPRSGSTSA